MNLNQSDDATKNSDKDQENQSSFIPKMSSSANSRIKRNLSDDSEIGSDKDIAHQISFPPKRPSTSTK